MQRKKERGGRERREKQRESGARGERECIFYLPRAGSGTPSEFSTRVTETEILGVFSVAFPDALTGSWIASRVAGM